VFEYPDLYSGFIDAIKAQLVRAGEDFFVDDYSEDSFLRPCLAALMRIDVSQAPEREIIDMDLERKLVEIASKLSTLARDVKKKFGLDLVEEAEDARRAEYRAREDEDAPIIVELSEGHYMSMQSEDTSLIECPGEDAHPADSNASRMSWMVPP
jgi:A1 cistron-splicing factor AAR2